MGEYLKQKKALRLKTIAEMYDMSERMLRNWCLTGRVRASKIGKQWFIRLIEIERVLDKYENVKQQKLKY